MTTSQSLTPFAARKVRVQKLREQVAVELAAGLPGLTIAANLCAATEQLLKEFVEETAATAHCGTLDELATQGVMIFVGGTGRGELAPYSDIDLLVVPARSGNKFEDFATAFLQLCWDAGFKMGSAMRDYSEALMHARQDPQAATALIEGRYFWGDESLFNKVTTAFKARVVDGRRRQFIEDCLAARQLTDDNSVPMSQELEPDVKSSIGGLRDLHLIRWIGFARYGVRDIESLRLRGALSKCDARELKDAWEFLTKVRLDLHLAAGKPQDRLTRDEQLRIAAEREIEATPEQRPVERFMQEYFVHSSAIAAVSRRFAAVQRPQSLLSQTRNLIVGHRAEGYFYVAPDRIDVARRHLRKVCENLAGILRLYRTSALYGVPPAPHVLEAVKLAAANMEAPTLTVEEGRIFLEIMRCTSALPMVLRSMAGTGVLDLVIPDYNHIRNLLQFNQYHHFTVDEHTLRAVEVVTSFEHDTGPIGTAYQAVRSKEVLHLAVLLHDIGKGFERDHSVVGREIGERIANRLGMSPDHREQLEFLILQHLVMADNAWRRDITDPKLLFEFSRDCGSPDSLRMLYLLTIADVSAVGPGTWTEWKGNLLTELFDRCLLILSGKHYSYYEQMRLRQVKGQVGEQLKAQPTVIGSDDQELRVPLDPAWIDHQLDGCSAYYLTCTAPEVIAEDLRTIAGLNDEAIEVRADWDEATQTTEYRVITRNPLATSGCFHKMAGVLTAKRLEILSADVNTTVEGIVVDAYRVRDQDYEGAPPDDRTDEVAQALRSVLNGELTIEQLFRRGRQFGKSAVPRGTSNLKTRVKIDNDSSESRTIIDVFAHDRTGLLYTIARTLNELNLSVDLAKISTHFDQVIDVFYVQEADQTKTQSEERLNEIQQTLMNTLTQFTEEDYKDFIK